MRTIAYPILEGKIAENGILKREIAQRLNITQRALTNKLQGRTTFTWPEVCTIQMEFFPDVDKERLFSRSA